MRALISVVVLEVALLQNPSIGREQQAPPKQKENSAKKSPPPSTEPTSSIVTNAYSTDKKEKPKEESKWWPPPPPPWDIYWPTLGLLVIGAVAAGIALCTLRDIRQQTENAKASAEAALLNAKLLSMQSGLGYSSTGKNMLKATGFICRITDADPPKSSMLRNARSRQAICQWGMIPCLEIQTTVRQLNSRRLVFCHREICGNRQNGML